MSSWRTVVCHVRASNAKRSEHGRDRDEDERGDAGLVLAESGAHAGTSTARRLFQRSLPASRSDEQDAEPDQRPGRAGGDRLHVLVRAVCERARVDERAVAEERREVAPVHRCGEQRHDANRDVLAVEAQRLGVERRLVRGGVVEVADDEQRAVLHVRAVERLLARDEPGRDARAAAERVPRRLREHRRAAVEANRREERDELEQRAGRRVRRQELVRRVGEHHEADRLVRIHDSLERRRDALVHGAGDARRHVEHDASGRRARGQDGGAARAGRRARGGRCPRASPRAPAASSRRSADVCSAGRRRRGRSARSTDAPPWTVSGTFTRPPPARRRGPARRTPRPPRPPAGGATRRARARPARARRARGRRRARRRRARTPCAGASRRRARAPSERSASARSSGVPLNASAPAPPRPDREIPARRARPAPRGVRGRPRPIASQNRSIGRIRNVGAATGESEYCQSYFFFSARPVTTPGLTCESTSTGGQTASMSKSTLPFGFRYSMCADGNRKTWNFSLGGKTGTHFTLRQRSVHVHVVCSNRPTRSRSTDGLATGVYGAKPALTRSRVESTHLVSETTASCAWIVSPKRWTAGVMVAYALSGIPSPTTEPDGWNGRPGCVWIPGGTMPFFGPAARAAAASVAATTAAARTSAFLTRPLRATSAAGRPSAGTRPSMSA